MTVILEELKNNLISEKVLRWSNKSNCYKRVNNWKNLISCKSIDKFNQLLCDYQSEDELWYCLSHNIDIYSDELLCPVCKSRRRKFTKKGYNTVCNECSANQNPQKIKNFNNTISNRTLDDSHSIGFKIKQSQISKYGCLGFNQWEKVKATKVKKYNNETFNNREKYQETCIQKYGVKSNLALYVNNQSEESLLKASNSRKKTLNEKYGVDYLWQIPGAQEKGLIKKQDKITKFESDNNCINQTKIFKKFGQDWLSIKNNLEFIYDDNGHKYLTQKSIEKIIDFKNNKFNNPISYRSNLEQEVCDFLTENKISYIKNCRTVLPNNNNRYYELDIYSEEYKIAIEINGIYWHSSLFKDKYYHERKSKQAEKFGIRLIHIYENEWKDPQTRSIIKSLLLIAFGKINNKIYARKCIIKEISNKEAKVFNDKNHLQGHRNAQITYGLFYNNELVQLMSFSRTHYNRNLKDNDDWEIIRGCPGSNNIVIGGVSKLLKHFISCHKPKNIFSYCDFNKFDGKSYLAANMKFIGYTGPDKHWIVGGKVIKRNPKKYKQLKDIAQATIWGSGSKKYLLTI